MIMHSYKTTFNIIEVAQALGIKIQKICNESPAQCPFCGDTLYHLSLNRQFNVFRCNRCDEHGGVVDLYAKYKGISKTDAIKELKEGLYRNQAHSQSAYKKPLVFTENPIKSVQERDAVYKELLSMLTLSDFHLRNLLGRGLNAYAIKVRGYKSIPVLPEIRKSICRRLSQKYELKGIPGFFTDKNGDWDFFSIPGFLIPFINLEGQIQGLQVRVDKPVEDKKYKWFSSTNLKNGTGAEGNIHVVGTSFQYVYVTEGALKADIANFLCGRTFIAVPGANAIKFLVDTLKAVSPEAVVLAYDMDRFTNPYVKKAYEKTYAILTQKFNVVDFTWDKRLKGIDDYLLFKKSSRASTGNGKCII